MSGFCVQGQNQYLRRVIDNSDFFNIKMSKFTISWTHNRRLPHGYFKICKVIISSMQQFILRYDNLENKILKTLKKRPFLAEKCDFSAFLAFLKISFSSLHNPRYDQLCLVFSCPGCRPWKRLTGRKYGSVSPLLMFDRPIEQWEKILNWMRK